jgi:hypothetical protein
MSKRFLTNGEIKLAQSIFSDSIDYPVVRVFDRGYAFLNAIGDMSYSGNMYLPVGHHHDFSRASLTQKRLFIHEGVHIWQHQNNIVNLVVAAVREGVKHQFQYAKAYFFRLDPGKDLLDYGFEQQAAIIEEHFLRKHGGPTMGRCLNEEHDTEALLKGVLKNFLDNPSYARRKRFVRPFLRSPRSISALTDRACLIPASGASESGDPVLAHVFQLVRGEDPFDNAVPAELLR